MGVVLIRNNSPQSIDLSRMHHPETGPGPDVVLEPGDNLVDEADWAKAATSRNVQAMLSDLGQYGGRSTLEVVPG